jgi:hypothetical protein
MKIQPKGSVGALGGGGSNLDNILVLNIMLDIAWFFIRLRRKPRAIPVDECVDDVRIIRGLKYCCFGGFR